MLSNIRVGYACTPVSIPYKTSRGFLLKNFNDDVFTECVGSNIKDLMSILKWNVKNDIYVFRISSDVIPFGSHPVNDINWCLLFKDELLECGEFIKENGIRVSMHRGQYTVLNSPSEDVVSKSIAELEYHCRFLDALEVDYTNKIVLHVGGEYGDKTSAIERFIQNFYRLSSSLRRRLVIENDDRIYTIEDVPVQFHYSDQDLIKKNGAHSKSVSIKNFLHYIESIRDFEADIMLEVKDKEVSALKCIYALKDSLKISIRTDQWAKYKYLLMEKNYEYYKRCSALVNSDIPMSEVYIYIDNCLNMPFDKGNFMNTAYHVYGYVKNKTTLKERENFNSLMEDTNENKEKIKKLLSKLCRKYDAQYINSSYYFVY